MIKQKSIVLQILEDLNKSKATPLLTGYKLVYKSKYLDFLDIAHALWNLKNSGVVSVYERNNQRFIKLTKKGELKILLHKARISPAAKWDGKWRLIMFDIPEGSRKSRNLLRRLLKQSGFKKLQASVFISPWPLNREAIEYLKQIKLMDFIRIMRIDDIDDDKDLKKKFGV